MAHGPAAGQEHIFLFSDRTHVRLRDGLLGYGPLGRQISVKSCCFQDAFSFKIVISVCSPMIQQ
jgi:hypothetical protein